MFTLNARARSLALFTSIATLSIALPPLQGGTPADDKEMRDYRLTMDKAQKYVAALTAIQADAKSTQCPKELKKNDLKAAPTLDAFEKKFTSCPGAVAHVKEAGLAPREIMIMSTVLLGGAMLAGVKKAGQLKEYPAFISPENAAFLEKNAEKLGPMLEPLMKSEQ
jgi:hypothetical protein